ncbi:hypothetical protein DL95DRAFT_397310, partial [Leptodontidium sp. 2 PMI_412]
NIKQNAEDFKLDPLELQAPIFRLKYLKKELEKRKSNPELLENYRTITITCLMPSYNIKWTNQVINKSTSNYLSHFRCSHKTINLNSIQARIHQSFSSQQSLRLLLNFIISNNISFYAVTIDSFKKLFYLNKSTLSLRNILLYY